MRKYVIFSVFLLLVPMVGAAAVIVAPPVREQLVEGHTVFSVIQVRNASEPARKEFAAAVAVLVREYSTTTNRAYERFPGVLWFNDQYLVPPKTDGPTPFPTLPDRYPCGAVIAVNAGDAVPLVGGVPAVPSSARHVEAYYVTDPNGNSWDVDKWSYDPDADPLTANSYLMWSVPINNLASRYNVPDDGGTACNTPKTDSPAGCGKPIFPFVDDTPSEGYGGPDVFTQDPVYHDTPDNATDRQPGDGEGRWMCLGGDGSTNGDLGSKSYNAVLFFFLEDLTDFGGVKDHSTASTDVNGCHATTHPLGAWPCPGGDDDAEGNSHPYNPEKEWPDQVSEGRNNHGGSSGCGAGDIGAAPQERHATCNIDVYFGFSQALRPAAPNYRVYDTEGRTAPYHCHDGIETCNEEEYRPVP